MKRHAADLLGSESREFAAKAGVRVERVGVGDPVSRWGSCSSSGTIRYSWRVIMAPPPVIDYLAAHEVAHLVHADHSPAYWSVVQRLIGDNPCAVGGWSSRRLPAGQSSR